MDSANTMLLELSHSPSRQSPNPTPLYSSASA
jgi:hypothetical protein